MVSTAAEKTTYTPDEAAAILEIPGETMRRWCRRGRVKAHYDRGIAQYGWVINREDFHAFLRSIDEAWRIPAGALDEKVS
jgi:excisionase family DNA binding protein